MKDLTGMKFGKLTVIKLTDRRSRNGGVICECKCDCGNTCYVKSSNLTSGNSKSCKSGEHKILDYNISINNTSGYKGVYWHKNIRKWISYICYKGKRYHLLCNNNINNCINIRKEAENAIANNTFEDWIVKHKNAS